MIIKIPTGPLRHVANETYFGLPVPDRGETKKNGEHSCCKKNTHTHTDTHRARHVEEVGLRRLHYVRFVLLKPRLIHQTYTERRRLAPEYMGSNTHTHQRTQLTIVEDGDHVYAPTAYTADDGANRSGRANL